MDILKKETSGKNFVKADTSEVYEDMTVPRAREICKELKGVEIDSTAEWIANRINRNYRDAKSPTSMHVKVNKGIVIRAIAGGLTEMRFGDESRMVESFPPDTIGYEKVNNFILRKEVGFLDTYHVLPDVKPYHPVQELVVDCLDGKVEFDKGSIEYKKAFAKSYEDYEGYGGFRSLLAKDIVENLGLDFDIKIKDAFENDKNMPPWEEKKKRREIFLHDLTS